MQVIKKIAFLFLLALTGVISKAQVRGIVIDSIEKTTIDRATIGLVLSGKLTDTIYTLTNDKGEFSFDKVPSSDFSLIVTAIGYWPAAKFIRIQQQEKTINIGVIVLTTKVTLLGDITVTSAPIVIKEDTVEYRADAFITKDGDAVEDLLKKLPGVQVDREGKVIAQGKEVTRARVNGKDFFGGDVKTAIKELPATIVAKIQVIDDYGDQATVSGIKDGKADKVINIELQKDKNKGLFGSVTVGGGTNDKYQASLNGNYFKDETQVSIFANSGNINTSSYDFSGSSELALSSNSNTGTAITNSFGTNYRTQWGVHVNAYGSYINSHFNTALEQYTSRTIAQNVNNEHLNSSNINNSHSATFNIEYQIDSFNYIKLTHNFSYSSGDNNSNTSLDYKLLNGAQALTGSNTTSSNSRTPNIGITILYNHKFRKRGRNFSASINAGNSETNFIQNITNLSSIFIPRLRYENTFQYIDQANNNYNYGVRLTYSEPLTKYRTLDISASYSLNSTRNNRQAFNVDSLTKNRTLNDVLSNDYENNFYNNWIGMSIHTTAKKYNYTLGISAQPVDIRGKSVTKDSAYKNITRVNVFPIARFVYNFSRSKSVTINYTGSANQPSFSQIQPVADSTNPQNVIKGNPLLKPSAKHNISLSFNKFNFISGEVFFTNLIFASVKNQIVNSTVLDALGKQTSSPQNVNGSYNIAVFYTFSKPYLDRRYVITLNGSAEFNHDINLFNASHIVGQNWIVNQGFVFEFNHKELVTLGAGINVSLNDLNYKKTGNTTLSNLQNASSNAYTFTHYGNITVTRRLILKYNVDYAINSGLASEITRNPVIMNVSLEQQLFKKQNGILRLTAFDLFKQNINVNRNIDGAAITDVQVKRLTRYFMLSFTYRLQKFARQ